MARGIFSDPLQSHAFWLFDVAPIDAISLPVFTPLIGFTSITAPEITVETQSIPEGNYFFTRKTIKRANVSNMTLSRGVAFYDSDFWRWMKASLEGNTQLGANANAGTGLGLAAFQFQPQIGGPTPRRTFVLVHFFARNPFGSGTLGNVVGIGAVTGLAGLLGSQANTTSGAGIVAGAQVGAGAAAAAALSKFGVGPFEFAARVPAKAYVLAGCLPVRYKVGSDFDASNSQVSIQELEISVDVMEEISLAAT